MKAVVLLFHFGHALSVTACRLQSVDWRTSGPVGLASWARSWPCIALFTSPRQPFLSSAVSNRSILSNQTSGAHSVQRPPSTTEMVHTILYLALDHSVQRQDIRSSFGLHSPDRPMFHVELDNCKALEDNITVLTSTLSQCLPCIGLQSSSTRRCIKFGDDSPSL